MKKAVQPKNWKLSVYLIKEEYEDFSLIIKGGIKGIEVKAGGKLVGMLYIKPLTDHRPGWLSFFDGYIDRDRVKQLFNKTISGVFLLKQNSRVFAITFGYGRSLLQMGCWEERFGLIVVLNTISRDRIRIIDRKNIDTMLTHTRSQASRECAIEEFGLDVQQVLLKAVMGVPKNEEFAKYIAGADALSIVYPASLSNIDDKCARLLKVHASRAYESEFPFMRFMSDLTDKQKVDELNERMVKKFRSGPFDRLYMAIPEIVDWPSIAGFRFKSGENALHYDLRIEDFLENVRSREEISIDFLKRRKVFQVQIGGDVTEERWTIFHCINCELDEERKTYILTEGRWYQIASSFVGRINDELKMIPKTKLRLPPAQRDEKENDYIRRVFRNDKSRYCLMDQKLIHYGGGHSKIEFCDLFTSDKKIIHIKRYSGSSVLSHLFSQGVNSAKAFLSDGEFRAKVNEILPENRRFMSSPKPSIRHYEIVFGIISESADTLPMALPFFSKLTLMNAMNELSGLLGFPMTVLGISIC